MIEYIEIGPTKIPGNCSRDIQAISEKGPFLLRNLIAPDVIARNFFVTDIKIGPNSQFISTGAIPLDYFARRGAVEGLYFYDLDRGKVITVSVTNMTSEPATFTAKLRGELLSGEVPWLAQRTVIGLGHTVVPALGRAKINVQPQVTCKPERFVVPLEVLGGLLIRDLRVEGVPVLTGQGEFDNGVIEVASRKLMRGGWLVVDVENATNQAKAFYGAVTATLEDEP